PEGRGCDGEGRCMMTGLIPENGGILHEKQFSRRSFVKGGGALIIAFSALGAAGAASAATGNTPFNSRTPNDFLPDLQQVDSWIAVTTDNKIIVTHGEPEFAGTP